jgi:hypothetical protein
MPINPEAGATRAVNLRTYRGGIAEGVAPSPLASTPGGGALGENAAALL